MTASVMPMYFASVDDRVFCFLDSQHIRPLVSMKTYPVYDLLSMEQLPQSAPTKPCNGLSFCVRDSHIFGFRQVSQYAFCCLLITPVLIVVELAQLSDCVTDQVLSPCSNTNQFSVGQNATGYSFGLLELNAVVAMSLHSSIPYFRSRWPMYYLCSTIVPTFDA